jgi:hypothetical protein
LAPQTISRKNRVAFDKTALRRRFSEDGFVIVEDFLSSEEADRLDRELERFIRMVVPRLEEPDVFHESGSNGPIKHLGRLEVYDSYFEQLQTRPKTLELVAASVTPRFTISSPPTGAVRTPQTRNAAGSC